MEKNWDIVVIGAGPGGYVAAIRGAQLGKKVLLIEKEKVGGTCMNWGCIPTKYLLHQTKSLKEIKDNQNISGPIGQIGLDWTKVQEEKEEVVKKLVDGIEFLLKRNGITVIKGSARVSIDKKIRIFLDDREENVIADKILLATGSRPAELPFLKPDHKTILTSRDVLALKKIPARLLVIGAGAIGLEMGTIYQRLGSDVEIVELLPDILPGTDRDIATRLERILKSQGLKIHTNNRIEECVIDKGYVCLRGTDSKKQIPFEFESDKVLLAIGRKPNSEDLLQDCPDLSIDKAGFIKVNSFMETNIPGIFAIGDLIGGKLLAHKASHEGIVAAENAAGQKTEIDYTALPLAVFTKPEFASVGISKTEAKEKGLEFKTGLFSLQASGRALTMGMNEGMVQIIADKQDKILGANILAPNASELISELTLAIKKGLKVQDVGTSIHIHPTLSESVMEAALRVCDEAIHCLND